MILFPSAYLVLIMTKKYIVDESLYGWAQHCLGKTSASARTAAPLQENKHSVQKKALVLGRNRRFLCRKNDSWPIHLGYRDMTTG